MKLLRAALLALLALTTFSSVPARADDNRPLFVEIAEQAPSEYRIRWKVPANLSAAVSPALIAPDRCTPQGRVRQWSDALGHWQEARWHCEPDLRGAEIGIDYPGVNPALATIARIRWADGEEQTHLSLPGVETIPLAEAKAAASFLDYVKLGIEHIWLGIDHLLFVAGLVWIARTWKRIVRAITGFTVAHSITLALAALDIIRLPVAAVEGVIALSIVFLAVEMVKGPRDTLTWRRPVAVAGSFGLLHGLGFAAVLREIGLPEEGFIAALFGFNVGIEIGQLIFAGSLALAFVALRKAWAHRRTPAPAPAHASAAAETPAAPQAQPFLQAQAVAGYALGIIASYWMFERLLA